MHHACNDTHTGPSDGISVPAGPPPVEHPPRPKKPRVLKPRQLAAIREQMTPDQWTLVQFGLETGLDALELFTLTAQDIDTANGLIYVPGDPLNGGRVVPLSAEARRIALAAIEQRPEGYLFGDPTNPDRDRVAWDFGFFQFGLASDRARMRGVTWQTLRDTAAARWLKAGTAPEVVRALLGDAQGRRRS